MRSDGDRERVIERVLQWVASAGRSVTLPTGDGASRVTAEDRQRVESMEQRGNPTDGGGNGPTSHTAFDDELLTDEEQIMRILRSRNGKMKQTEIVEQSPWSKAKVSRRLSRMEDDGRISRIQVGRQKVVMENSRAPQFGVAGSEA